MTTTGVAQLAGTGVAVPQSSARAVVRNDIAWAVKTFRGVGVPVTAMKVGVGVGVRLGVAVTMSAGVGVGVPVVCARAVATAAW